MSYIDDTLMSNEKIIYRTKPHWIIFLSPILWLLLAILSLAIGPYITFIKEDYLFSISLYQLVALILIICSIVTALSACVTYLTSEFAITNKRVLFKTGLIHRISIGIYYERIESISLYQNILAQLLNYGLAVIHGTGGTHDRFPYLPDPTKFRLLVLEQRQKLLHIKD